MRIIGKRGLLSRLAFGIALLLVGSLPSTAAAHASMVGSDPANGALVSPSLGRVVAYYDLPLQADTSTIEVFNAAGEQVDLGDGKVVAGDAGRKSMAVSLPKTLPAGAYVVHWHALSDEGVHTGHVTEGDFSFWVDGGAGTVRPGLALAGLALLGGLASAFVLVRAEIGEGA
jgi:methionine-rich copper-binding protein CopC